MSSDERARVSDESSGESATHFIAILGHELRSRLAPIRNVADLLKCERLEVTTRRDIAGIIDRQVIGMARLVDDLLDMARFRSGRLKLQRQFVSLQDVIEHAVEIARPLVIARSHSIVVTPPAAPLSVECDLLWLSQAIQNVICNAAKYTEPGGTIVIEAHREGTDAVIGVSDTGIGISPQNLEAIFDPYVRLARNQSIRTDCGLGVGLHLVRLILEAHGGSVKAVSEGLGFGSAFILRLPALVF